MPFPSLLAGPRRAAVLLALAAGCAAAGAQDPASAQARTLAAQFAASTLPGACMAAVRDGRVVQQQAFGHADVASRRPYTLQTVQPVGSVSKTFIGLALVKALELGLLGPQGLDTPVDALLPELRVVHPWQPQAAITLRQLATHTSGIVDREAAYADAYRFGRRQAAESLQAYLRSYLLPGGRRYRRANFAKAAPGAAFHYSNIGSALAAHAIARRAGMPFEQFVAAHVLRPLGMLHSGYWPAGLGDAPQATLYGPQRQALPPYVLATYPDGGLRSSCDDLVLYLLALLQGASGVPAAVLTPAGFAQLLQPQFPAPGAAGRPQGLSDREPNQAIFFTLRRDGSVGHTGSDHGVSAFLFIDPATRSGRVFMSNVDIGADPALLPAFAALWKTLGE